MWECENCNSSFLEWGEYPSLGTIVYPSTEITSSSTLIHSAEINQLSPNTKYYYMFIGKIFFYMMFVIF